MLEGLRGEDSIAELCRKEGINQNLHLSTVLDDFSRYILAWKLCTTMSATDVSDTLQVALRGSGLTQVKVLHRPKVVAIVHRARKVRTTSATRGRPEAGGRPAKGVARSQGTMATTSLSYPDAVVGSSRSSPLSLPRVRKKHSSLCSLSFPPRSSLPRARKGQW